MYVQNNVTLSIQFNIHINVKMKFYVLGHYVKTIQINIKTPNRETCTYIVQYNNSKAYKVGVRSMGHQEKWLLSIKKEGCVNLMILLRHVIFCVKKLDSR